MLVLTVGVGVSVEVAAAGANLRVEGVPVNYWFVTYALVAQDQKTFWTAPLANLHSQ